MAAAEEDSGLAKSRLNVLRVSFITSRCTGFRPRALVTGVLLPVAAAAPDDEPSVPSANSPKIRSVAGGGGVAKISALFLASAAKPHTPPSASVLALKSVNEKEVPRVDCVEPLLLLLLAAFFCIDADTAESKGSEEEPPPFFDDNLPPAVPLPEGLAPASGSYDEDRDELEERDDESSSESSDESSSLHESEELELSLLDEHDELLSERRSFASPFCVFLDVPPPAAAECEDPLAPPPA